MIATGDAFVLTASDGFKVFPSPVAHCKPRDVGHEKTESGMSDDEAGFFF